MGFGENFSGILMGVNGLLMGFQWDLLSGKLR
jgi:hypothetical protein